MLQMAEDYINGFGMHFEPGDIILTVPPLYHIFAFNFNFLLLYRAGGRNLLIPNPRPLSNLRPAFEQFSVQWMTGVDTLFAGLLAEPWFQAAPPALKAAVSGGTALRPTTHARWLAAASHHWLTPLAHTAPLHWLTHTTASLAVVAICQVLWRASCPPS